MHIATLVFAALTVQLCSAACLLLISRKIAGLDGLHCYGWAYVCLALGTGLALLGHGDPDGATVLGRTVALWGAVLLTQGASDFVVPGSDALTWGGIFTAVIAVAEVGLWQWGPYPVTAAVVVCGAVAVQVILTALILYSHRDPVERGATRMAAAMLAGMVLLMLLRVVLTPLGAVPANIFASDPARTFEVSVYLILSVGLAFSFVWMAIARVRSQLEVQARTDALTGLLNRRALQMASEREIAACRLRHAPLTLLALDLDHFKQINDRYGHAGGDAVLVAAARLLCQGLRTTDMVARLGGEEFAVVLPDRDAQRGVEIAERLRSRFEEMQLNYEGQILAARASLGVAELGIGEDWNQLLRRADLALYRAKGNGRNRSCLARPVEVMPVADPIATGVQTTRAPVADGF